MKQIVTRKLFSYWNDLRRERAAPERIDIDPAAIRGLLGDTFLLEIDAPRAFPVRLAGSRIDALFVRDLKGTSFFDLWAPEEHASLRALIESVLDDPTPAVAGVATAPPGREPLELELLLLPLRHHGRTHARVLGALTPALVPGWFGLIPVEPMRLTSLRILQPAQLAALAAEPAEPVTFATVTLTHSEGYRKFPLRHQHLTVLEGGRQGR
jgi:hypothetical protein